jgi:hypothetical protein
VGGVLEAGGGLAANDGLRQAAAWRRCAGDDMRQAVWCGDGGVVLERYLGKID